MSDCTSHDTNAECGWCAAEKALAKAETYRADRDRLALKLGAVEAELADRQIVFRSALEVGIQRGRERDAALLRLETCREAMARALGLIPELHSEPARLLREAFIAIDVEGQGPCTCHPDDNPPVPCARKYALEECRAAAVQDQGLCGKPVLLHPEDSNPEPCEQHKGHHGPCGNIETRSAPSLDARHLVEFLRDYAGDNEAEGNFDEADKLRQAADELESLDELESEAVVVEKLKPPECTYCFPKDGKHAASCELASASEGQSTPIHKCAFCGESQIKSNHVCSGTTTALDRRGTE